MQASKQAVQLVHPNSSFVHSINARHELRPNNFAQTEKMGREEKALKSKLSVGDRPLITLEKVVGFSGTISNVLEWPKVIIKNCIHFLGL